MSPVNSAPPLTGGIVVFLLLVCLRLSKSFLLRCLTAATQTAPLSLSLSSFVPTPVLTIFVRKLCNPLFRFLIFFFYASSFPFLTDGKWTIHVIERNFRDEEKCDVSFTNSSFRLERKLFEKRRTRVVSMNQL